MLTDAQVKAKIVELANMDAEVCDKWGKALDAVRYIRDEIGEEFYDSFMKQLGLYYHTKHMTLVDMMNWLEKFS